MDDYEKALWAILEKNIANSFTKKLSKEVAINSMKEAVGLMREYDTRLNTLLSSLNKLIKKRKEMK